MLSLFQRVFIFVIAWALGQGNRCMSFIAYRSLRKKRNTKNARGIVLVMILGILAVMVIMAVSFAVAMRTERLASGNAAENIRMRMLLDTALARAIEDLRLQFTNQVYPLEDDVFVSVMPDDLACVNIGVSFDDFTNGTEKVRAGETNFGLLYGEAANHIPSAFYDEAVAADLESLPYTNRVGLDSPVVINITAPRWVPVVEPFSLMAPGGAWPSETTHIGGDTIVISNVGSRVLGRVGWVAVNCSGLLDVNFVGGLTRTNGCDPREICIVNLPEIQNEPSLLSARDEYVRYDTLDDFYSQNKNFLRNSEYPSNLFVYSFAQSGCVTNYGTTNAGVFQPVSLAGDVSDLMERRANITNMFAGMGFSGAEAGDLFTNLLDYVDNDSIPRLPANKASAEAMPLLNEVVITHRFRKEDLGSGAYQYIISSSAQVELWYPYASKAAAPLNQVSNRISASYVGSTSGWVPSDPDDSWLVMDLAPDGFYVGSIDLGSLTKVFTALDPAPPASVNCSITINNATFVNGVLQREGRVFNAAIDNNTGPFGASETNVIWECLDPRLGGADAFWVNQESHTLDQINQVTLAYWADTNNNCNGQTLYFCANTGIVSAAELFNLPLQDKPWCSIRLFGENLHPVLDYFSAATNADLAHPSPTNKFYGLVNPNTTQRDVLACVFDNVPIMDCPGGAVLGNLSSTDALLLADRIIAEGPYTNLSEIGKADWDGFFTSCSAAAQLNTALKRATFLHNIAGLLNLRQNVFTIILGAELAGQDSDRFPRRPVRQRAVAVVWRDPYLNKFFVRSFKYLPD